MTIWCVHNRPDEPITVPTSAAVTSTKSKPKTKTTIAQITKQRKITRTTNKSSSTTKWTHSLFVRWQRMNVISFGVSGCWHWILYGIIIINLISQIPSTANAGISNVYATPAASTRPSNIFESDRIQCPSFVDNSACPCYKFEDGKLIFVISFQRFWYFVFCYNQTELSRSESIHSSFAFEENNICIFHHIQRSISHSIYLFYVEIYGEIFSLAGNHRVTIYQAIIEIMHTNIINSPKRWIKNIKRKERQANNFLMSISHLNADRIIFSRHAYSNKWTKIKICASKNQ